MKSERISPFWVGGYQPFSAQMNRMEKSTHFIEKAKQKVWL